MGGWVASVVLMCTCVLNVVVRVVRVIVLRCCVMVFGYECCWCALVGLACALVACWLVLLFKVVLVVCCASTVLCRVRLSFT